MFRPIYRRTAILLTAWIILLTFLSIRGFFSDFSKLPPYGNGMISPGIRSRHIANVNGMTATPDISRC